MAKTHFIQIHEGPHDHFFLGFKHPKTDEICHLYFYNHLEKYECLKAVHSNHKNQKRPFFVLL